MKRTRIKNIPFDIPKELCEYLDGSWIYDSSCSPEARVYYIERRDLFLKRSAKGTLKNEALMNAYFHSKGIGAEVIAYESDGYYDWLLTRRVAGEDATHSDYLSDPKRLAECLGTRLRELHETDFRDCPRKNVMVPYLTLAEENYKSGCYDKSHFPDSFGYASADDAWRVLSEGKELLLPEVLIHGDYCLPNIILDGWRLSGFIDVGHGGVGDRHIDLFWGSFTLGFNLGTNEYTARFFDAYGRDKIDPDRLRVVAAAEVFG